MSKPGQLERLLIQAFTRADYSGAPIDSFEAYVNPAELTLSYEMEYDSAQGSGTTGSRMDFKKVKPGDLTLNFFLDGTGANGRALDVQQKIASFQGVTATTATSTDPTTSSWPGARSRSSAACSKARPSSTSCSGRPASRCARLSRRSSPTARTTRLGSRWRRTRPPT